MACVVGRQQQGEHVYVGGNQAVRTCCKVTAHYISFASGYRLLEVRLTTGVNVPPQEQQAADTNLAVNTQATAFI